VDLPAGECHYVTPRYRDVEARVRGISDAAYRGFNTEEEAETWLRETEQGVPMG